MITSPGTHFLFGLPHGAVWTLLAAIHTLSQIETPWGPFDALHEHVTAQADRGACAFHVPWKLHQPLATALDHAKNTCPHHQTEAFLGTRSQLLRENKLRSATDRLADLA